MKWGIGLLSTLIAVLILFAIPDASAFTSTKIIPPDIAPGDNYGNAVFISGDYAIVGSPLDDDACLPAVDSICDSGAAYIFERDASGVWNFVQKLVASDAAKFVEFGSDVFISGNFAFVGSIGDEHDVTGGPNAGSVYVFERNAEGEWIEIQKIQTSDGSSHAFFGYSIFVSENTMVVGLPLSNAHSLDSGTAYIFERNAEGEWIEINEIFPTDIAERDEFGRGVSVFGSTAIIGSPNDDDDGSNSGSAYIFERDANGNWGQTAKLTASNAAAGDLFGISTFILDNSAFVGAITKEEIPHPVLGTLLLPFGSVYVFEKNAEGEWIETEILLPPDLVCCHNMGVDISVSGNLLIAGDTFESVAHVFEKDDSGTWSQIEKVSGSDTLDDDSFGFSVSISGENAIVGAPFHSIDGEDPGFFEESGGAWIFGFGQPDVAILTQSSPEFVSPSEEFKYDVTISNIGDVDATDVEFFSTFTGPGTVTSVSFDPFLLPDSSCRKASDTSIVCDFSSIAKGEFTKITVIVTVNDDAVQNDAFTISNNINPDDANNDNNQAVLNHPTVVTADLQVMISPNIDPVIPNEKFDYQLRVLNKESTNVEATDVLLTHVFFHDKQGEILDAQPEGICDVIHGDMEDMVECRFDKIGIGFSQNVIVTAQVGDLGVSSDGSNFQANIEAFANGGDLDDSDNKKMINAPKISVDADLQVVKVVSDDETVQPGEVFVTRFLVLNNDEVPNPADAEMAVITGTLTGPGKILKLDSDLLLPEECNVSKKLFSCETDIMTKGLLIDGFVEVEVDENAADGDVFKFEVEINHKDENDRDPNPLDNSKESQFPRVSHDADGDGIKFNVDTQPNTPSADFSDGITTGTVNDSGDQTLSISKTATGINISSIFSTGTTPATVSICNNSSILTIDQGDSVDAICGSAILDVISGPVEIQLIDDDGNVGTTTLQSGDSIEFDEKSFTIINNGSGDVIVEVNGIEITIEPGETVDVPTTPTEQINNLKDAIISMNLPKGTETSLTSNLDSAIEKLEDGNSKNDSAVCGMLDSFINKINAQNGKKVSSEQADLLREIATIAKILSNCS